LPALQHTIYKHGTAVMENMSAEERLMRNIPKAATKAGPGPVGGVAFQLKALKTLVLGCTNFGLHK
jgi:hypothetical protein